MLRCSLIWKSNLIAQRGTQYAMRPNCVELKQNIMALSCQYIDKSGTESISYPIRQVIKPVHSYLKLSVWLKVVKLAKIKRGGKIGKWKLLYNNCQWSLNSFIENRKESFEHDHCLMWQCIFSSIVLKHICDCMPPVPDLLVPYAEHEIRPCFKEGGQILSVFFHSSFSRPLSWA